MDMELLYDRFQTDYDYANVYPFRMNELRFILCSMDILPDNRNNIKSKDLRKYIDPSLTEI
jgi:hypothetical protein